MTRRLYCQHSIYLGAIIDLMPDQARYLHKVMRLRTGADVMLFNQSDGQWSCNITHLEQHSATVVVQSMVLNPSPHIPLYLACSPTKQCGMVEAVEKATELGVTDIFPTITARTVVRSVNLDKLNAVATGASQQCERLSPPIVHAPLRLEQLLEFKPFAGSLLFLRERSGITQSLDLQGLSHCLLVGPEGGFTNEEMELVSSCPFTISIGLGPHILRADTAVVAGLALYQTLYGRWQ